MGSFRVFVTCLLCGVVRTPVIDARAGGNLATCSQYLMATSCPGAYLLGQHSAVIIFEPYSRDRRFSMKIWMFGLSLKSSRAGSTGPPSQIGTTGCSAMISSSFISCLVSTHDAPGTVPGTGDRAPAVKELAFHLECVACVGRLSSPPDQHCSIELPVMMGMLPVCAVQDGSRYPRATVEHLKCGQ